MSDFEQEEELATVAQLKNIETSLKNQISHAQPRQSSPLPIVAAIAAAIGLAGGYIGAQFAGATGEKGDTGAQGIQGPKGDPGKPGIGAEFPKNAVLAFDDSAGCPDGWEPFRAAQSRTIIGATFGTGSEPGLRNNETGSPLIERKYRDHGGAESVTLTAEQMPRHRHNIPYAGVSSDSDFQIVDAGAGANIALLDYSERTDLRFSTKFSSPEYGVQHAGNNQPHNNMPPYIALYFCQKT